MINFANELLIGIVNSTTMRFEYDIKIPDEYKKIIHDIFTWHQTTLPSQNLVLALEGDLGAGKTTFTQQLAKMLSVEEHVTSPTFTIMKGYEITHPDFTTLIHIDAYRIESEEEAVPIKIVSLLTQPQAIVCIEWPEQIASYIPKTAVRLQFTITENENRHVVVLYPETE